MVSDICARQILTQLGAPNSSVKSYIGTAPLLSDMLNDQIGAACVSIGSVKSFVNQGKIKALAVALPYSIDALPSASTLESQNITGVIYGDWLALMAPKGTSSSTVNSMALAIKQSLGDGNVQSKLSNVGFDPIPSDDTGPIVAEKFIRKQAARLAPFAKRQ